MIIGNSDDDVDITKFLIISLKLYFFLNKIILVLDCRNKKNHLWYALEDDRICWWVDSKEDMKVELVVCVAGELIYHHITVQQGKQT